MRELELKEKKIKEIQSTGDRLLREGHPARPTVEVGWARPVVAGGWAEGGPPRPLRPGGGGRLRGRALGPPVAGWEPEKGNGGCAVLPGGPADPVELDASAVLLYRGSPEGEHSLFPGENRLLPWAPPQRP